MKYTLLTVAGLLVAAVTAAPLSEDQYQFLFVKFAQEYKKTYATSELFPKFNTFKANLDMIIAHNAQGLSWKMGVNQFTDLTAQEFSKVMGFTPHLANTSAPSVGEIPCSTIANKINGNGFIDWDEKGKTAPVQNQGQCGSCWAFSSISGLESVVAIKNNAPVVKLSEEHALQCSTSNSACNGGLMELFYKDVMNGKLGPSGVCTAADYPYTARKSTCEKTCTGVVGVKEFCRMPITKGSETDDATWVSLINQAPITIGIAASSSRFQMYSSGVLTGCNDKSHNHAVVITGYGEENGERYWKIRNSWGSSWGEKGYIRVSTSGQQCGTTASGRDIVVTEITQ